MTTSTTMTSEQIDTVLRQAEGNFAGALDRLCDLLRIPSVSTDPAYLEHCRAAGQWVVDQLSELGFEGARLRGSDTHPLAFGHYRGPKGYEGPHLLFYGHYDVQPPDPLELWESPPFEPQIIDAEHGKRIVARGAVDDKGQVMTFIEGMRAWKDAVGEIPCRITCVIEGEEEAGSEVIEHFLHDAKDELVGGKAPDSPCDFALISDTGMWDIDTPAITAGLRGLLYVELILHGPSHDLHSGHYGGCIPNPINELASIIARMHEGDRRVAVPGFYDDVRPLSEARRAQWKALGFDEEAFLHHAGFETGYGEVGYSSLERQWARPTCDVNGISGGYEGEGAKTVIASHAKAKVSFRLVPNQDPAKILSSLKVWLEGQVPSGCRLEVLEHGTGTPYEVDESWPVLDVARQGLRDVFGKEPLLAGCGGSIPIVESFKRVLGVDSLLVGFGLEDDRVHSPNEKFEVKCYESGIRSHVVLLGRLAGMLMKK